MGQILAGFDYRPKALSLALEGRGSRDILGQKVARVLIPPHGRNKENGKGLGQRGKMS